MNSTKLIGKIFVPRQKEIDLYGTKAEEIQARVFRKLIHKASATEWGMRYDYNHIQDYTDFQRVPIQTYEDVKGYVDRMRHGERNVLWPGRSSGMPNHLEPLMIKVSLFLSVPTD